MAKMYVEVKFIGRRKFDQSAPGTYRDLVQTVTVVSSGLLFSAIAEAARVLISQNYTVVSWTGFLSKGMVPEPMTTAAYNKERDRLVSVVPCEFKDFVEWYINDELDHTNYEEGIARLTDLIDNLGRGITNYAAMHRLCGSQSKK
jgi:hypothetical protein